MLIRDLILDILDHVVGLPAPAQVAICDDLQHVISGFPLTGMHLKATLQLLDRVSTETREPRIEHEGHQGDYGLTVRSVTQ